MNRFKNIVLVFDPETSDLSTFRRAAALAQDNLGRLSVVSVLPSLHYELLALNSKGSPKELKEHAVKERQRQIKHFIRPIEGKVGDVTCVVLTGTPFLEIIRQVIRDKHDLVMITAEGITGMMNRLFGSTSLHLMRKCPCPVWVMKPARRRRYSRIMAAVDPGTLNQERNALNTLIMDLATSMAILEQSELHIVFAWSLLGENHIRVFGYESLEEINRWRYSVRNERQKQLDELLSNYRLQEMKCKIHLVEGAPEIMIPELAKKSRIDLIVMGTVCRTGISGFFIGNTAEEVLQQVKCSVLTVKPEGFVSPVKVE